MMLILNLVKTSSHTKNHRTSSRFQICLDYPGMNLLLYKPFSFQSPHTNPFPVIYQNWCVFVLLFWSCASAMVCAVKDVGGVKIRCPLLVLSVECFSTPEFSVSFNTMSLRGKDFLCSFLASTFAPTGAILPVVTEKSQCTTSKQFKT